jgi:hypothetical protein
MVNGRRFVAAGSWIIVNGSWLRLVTAGIVTFTV